MLRIGSSGASDLATFRKIVIRLRGGSTRSDFNLIQRIRLYCNRPRYPSQREEYKTRAATYLSIRVLAVIAGSFVSAVRQEANLTLELCPAVVLFKGLRMRQYYLDSKNFRECPLC